MSSLIAGLRNPSCYPHPVQHIEVLETHISWVVLTGPYAYKIKKPLNLGFLDFSTLARRRHSCEEELRLNRRLAPWIYEAVVKIGGSPAQPQVGGSGPALEYALKMREFAQGALASRMLAGGLLRSAHIDALAARIAAFHARSGVAAHGSPYGSAQAVLAAARDNFAQLAGLLEDPVDKACVAELRAWTEREYNMRLTQFVARQADGFVRECHGDLHLANIVMLEDGLTPFDCIEFSPALRWIDVMNEVAFLVMDLMDRGHTDFAYRFLNAYLEARADYAGLEVLRFYLVYRAMVRAKVHALRAAQEGVPAAERARLLQAGGGYVRLARQCTHDAQPAIVLMHGMSGSGKSVIAQSIAEHIGAIRLRSDIERKRLGGLAALERSRSPLAAGIYTPDLTFATYDRLLDLARSGANAGYRMVVDATFLMRWQRDLFRHQAHAHGVPLVIVDVVAPEPVLRARIDARLAAGTDASEADQAVLTRQFEQSDALGADELADTLRIDTAYSDWQSTAREACAALCSRLAASVVQQPHHA